VRQLRAPCSASTALPPRARMLPPDQISSAQRLACGCSDDRRDSQAHNLGAVAISVGVPSAAPLPAQPARSAAERRSAAKLEFSDAARDLCQLTCRLQVQSPRAEPRSVSAVRHRYDVAPKWRSPKADLGARGGLGCDGSRLRPHQRLAAQPDLRREARLLGITTASALDASASRRACALDRRDRRPRTRAGQHGERSPARDPARARHGLDLRLQLQGTRRRAL
jgi:hypothetical protein